MEFHDLSKDALHHLQTEDALAVLESILSKFMNVNGHISSAVVVPDPTNEHMEIIFVLLQIWIGQEKSTSSYYLMESSRAKDNSCRNSFKYTEISDHDFGVNYRIHKFVKYYYL